MAVLEAMAAGVPVLLSPGCNLPQAQASGAGLIVEPTPQALADALNDMLNEPTRLQAMGRAARQLVQDHFTWDAVAAQLEQVYSGMVT